MNNILIYLGSFLVAAWGIAHLFPTKSVVKGFGEISTDNQRIITMEWINEGATLVFIGAVVALSTYIDASSIITRAVCWLSFIMLNVLSMISFFTGFRVNFLPFKLCPIIFTSSSIIILAGNYL